MKVGIKESVLSIALFAGVLIALASVDDRVRSQFEVFISGSNGSSLAARASDLGDALLSAARYQSIEHAPLVAFAAVSAVLVLFMVRT